MVLMIDALDTKGRNTESSCPSEASFVLESPSAQVCFMFEEACALVFRVL